MNRVLTITAIASLLLAGVDARAQPEYKLSREDVEKLGAPMQRQIGGLQYMLNAYQIKAFVDLPDDPSRQQWLDVFWKSNDPTPVTEKNEMQIEHSIRVGLARQFFNSKKWPGWDKRGEVFIRYGPPDVRAKIHAEVTVRKTHPPGELWFYSRFGMIIQFRDETLNGHYIYAISALGASQDMSPELAEYFIYEAANRSLETMIPEQFLEFYRDTEFDPDSKSDDWSPLHDAIAGPQEVRVTRPRMRGVTERWDEAINPDDAKHDVAVPSTIFFTDKAQQMANRFEEVLDDTPTAYPFNFEREDYPFFFGIAQFKAGGGINRVEVNLELPIEPGEEREKSQTRGYRAEAVFFDAQYGEIAREDRDIVLPVRRGEDEDVRLMPAQIVFSLPENYYRMAVTVTEVRPAVYAEEDSATHRKERESAYRSTMHFKNFENNLVLSDILFAQKIEPAEKQSPFIRGAMEVVPHPIRRYKLGSPVPLYFELYNLSVDETGMSSYEVEYRIVPHTPDKKHFWDRFDGDEPVVSSRFSASGYSSDESQYVTVKSQNLDKGAYDFLVTVKDVNSQSVTYRRATFRIVE